jgi:hypothetical protein
LFDGHGPDGILHDCIRGQTRMAGNDEFMIHCQIRFEG